MVGVWGGDGLGQDGGRRGNNKAYFHWVGIASILRYTSPFLVLPASLEVAEKKH